MKSTKETRLEKMQNDLIVAVGDIRTATREQIEIFADKNFGKYSLSTKQNRICELNKIIKNNGSLIKISNNSDGDFIDIEGIHSESELKDIIKLIINPQDKFIIWALYKGICGVKAEDLLSLKSEDFNVNKRTLKVGEKKIELDDYFYNITLDAINQKIYIKNNKSLNEKSNEDYEFNLKNPYIIKGKITTKNNNGLDKFGYQGFRRRVRILGETNGVVLRADDLYDSNLLNEMHKSEIEFTTYNIKKWFKENNYKANGFLLLKKYNLKYKGE